ncbi:GRB10-interacting GYF protein 1 isoform X1 [Hemibagrus wyckioides]|uniref:GRB10-interacting GYF protein 1 isoform X1 n=2 Tax=Hemibagrus wyckioides TaxID=337641 RepID=UPI00266D005D|nr:GRB10-interacting GYF protein 1 isoform X1 [Hemibagrus wyckioides]XP_058251256.1 GRB10-interacting GYF protein 1 isoform X1 [Hemibagrus wyckioides]
MTAETLNFGPEWLRALSSGGSVTSPPPSPAMPKYKLAEYRYGREEMLALYVKDNKIPEDMQDKVFAAILQDEPQQPLALVPLTEEEQRNFSMSVNSVAVLRLMGKGGGAIPASMARGRGSVRGGRGRGRGESGFYQRSTEDGEVGFSRSVREIHRSQSWDDRGERRFEKPLRREGLRVGFEEVGSGGRKEFMRSDSDNWRTLREEHELEEGGDTGGSWRLAGSRRDDGGPRSAGWREHGGEVRRRKFDFDFRDGGSEGGRRRAGSEGAEEERDGLPEWCTDEEDGEMGTFDSSGAFMPIKKGSKDPIPEEEFEFQGLEDEDECGTDGEKKDSSTGDKAERDETDPAAVCEVEVKPLPPSSPSTMPLIAPQAEPVPAAAPICLEDSQPAPAMPSKMPSEVLSEPVSELSPSASSSLPSSPPSSSSAATDLPPPGGDPEDDEGMKHLQQEAEKMVAALQDTSLEEECFTQTLQESRNTAAALPLSHDSAMKWFYKDPQGEIQGPFSTVEMCEWFQAGYFSMSLLVKRGCDEGFQPLGDVIKMWGRVPFAPGPSPPPLLCNLDQDRLKKQQELATAALYQQLQQHQLFQLINRCGEQGMMPSMNRSMSVPDTGSMWDMHTSASQPTGGEASLWDLTMNSSTQGPTLEQLQKLQERREAELRAKREEEERKRRDEKRRQQQEEQKRREEEELFRRKQQELLMKLLQQQAPRQAASGTGSGWSTGPVPGLGKQGKSINTLEIQQDTERLYKQQQRAQQQRWATEGLWGSAGMDGKAAGGSSPSGGSMGVWDEALKNQSALRSGMGLKNSRSSPSLSDQYMMMNRRKRTEDEERLLKLLQGMKAQDGFTTWCEQMLHALNTSANNSNSSIDVSTIVAYLKEVESPYEVLDFIRSYLGDTVEAKEFAKQFLERRAKQKANHQRQQQLSKEVGGLTMNSFPLQDSMRGMNPAALQSMFQAVHSGKGGMGYDQAGKLKKKQPMMLHSDPSILGYSFHGAGDRMSLSEMEMVEDY